MNNHPDWDWAPEGATHYSTKNGLFYRYTLGQLLVFMSAEWQQSGLGASYVKNLTALPEAWNGRGLPPIGLTVHIPDRMACGNDFLAQFEGLDVKIVGHTASETGTPLAVFQYKVDGGTLRFHALAADNGNFVPLRTPEQIVADGRLQNIRNAHTAIARTLDQLKDNIPGGAVARVVVEAMIDAGYRKPEGGDV